MAEFYAVMSGRPALHVKPVPDLKPRKERAPSMEPTEHAMQVGVIQWWNLACKGYGLPRFALFAIPNAAILRGDQTQRAIQMNYMKAEGLRTGAPDLILAAARQGYHSLMIEMKRGKEGRVSPDQHEFHHYLRNAGYWVEVPRSAEMAISCIKTYLGDV